MRTNCLSTMAVAAFVGAAATTASGQLLFDQNVIPDIIFGAGNANGAFTAYSSSQNGIELGLRSKLRYPSPMNTFNSNGDGTYSWPAESFFTSGEDRFVWNFEWSVNTDFLDQTGRVLDDLTYELGIDGDPSTGTNFLTFDPINGVNPGTGSVFWDHAIGDNTTPNGGGAVATSQPQYATLISSNSVAQQSWVYGFFDTSGPLAGLDPTMPGEFTVYLEAFDSDNTSVGYTEITIINGPRIVLQPVNDCLDSSTDTLVVEVVIDNVIDASGVQLFLDYDTSNITFVSADPSVDFPVQIFESVDTVAGTIDYATGVPLASGANVDGTFVAATLTFNVDNEFCFEEDLITFSTMSVLPSRITDPAGDEIPSMQFDLPGIRNDNTAPTVVAPADLMLNADAGLCTATLAATGAERFDDPVQTGTGFWEVDRYQPATFQSTFFDGDNRLQLGLSAADGPGMRPSSFSSAFYNTQGYKYDVDLAPGYAWSGDVYIDSGFATQVRRTDIWGETRDGLDQISGYPILGFASNDPDDPLNTTPANPQPRFRAYVQDVDQNSANGSQPGWIDLGLPSGFSYDRWYTLEVELTQSTFEFRVIDDTDTVVLSLSDPSIFGSVRTNSVFIQSYNFGESYDVYWDNVVLGPEGPMVLDNCSGTTVVGARSDSLSLNDPFPFGPTTITWTATDFCGNVSSDTQVVTVADTNTLEVAVELQPTVESTPFDRCITFGLSPANGDPVVEVSSVMTFTSGIGVATIDVPCGDYDCITARDTLHTLRSTDNDDFGIAGGVYVADFTDKSSMSGDNDWLIGGNLNDDAFIDILDFGAYIGQFGVNYGAPDTTCATAPIHADISGDGIVGTGDFTFITNNFLTFSEVDCDGLLSTGAPMASVRVRDLAGMGLAHLAEADLNGDRVIDESDIAAFASGVRPISASDVNRDGAIDMDDLNVVLGSFGQQTPAGDANGDSMVDFDDLLMVIDNFGVVLK